MWSPAGARLTLLKSCGPRPPPKTSITSGRCRPLNRGAVNAPDVLLLYPGQLAAGSQKLSVRGRRAGRAPQRRAVGIRLPDRQSGETRCGCRGSGCTNLTVVFLYGCPSQPTPRSDRSKPRRRFHPSSCFLSALWLLQEMMSRPLKALFRLVLLRDSLMNCPVQPLLVLKYPGSADDVAVDPSLCSFPAVLRVCLMRCL